MDLNGIIKKTNEIISKSTECSVATVQKDGYPHVATRSFCTSGNVEKSYISTDYSGNLAQTIMKNAKMSICVRTEADNVTMIGNATIVNDLEVKQKMWQDWFIDHYKGGVSDPEYCVIEFTTQRLSLWVDRQIVKISIDEINKQKQ